MVVGVEGRLNECKVLANKGKNQREGVGHLCISKLLKKISS